MNCKCVHHPRVELKLDFYTAQMNTINLQRKMNVNENGHCTGQDYSRLL